MTIIIFHIIFFGHNCTHIVWLLIQLSALVENETLQVHMFGGYMSKLDTQCLGNHVSLKIIPLSFIYCREQKNHSHILMECVAF
jgi:hypothetical protein